MVFQIEEIDGMISQIIETEITILQIIEMTIFQTEEMMIDVPGKNCLNNIFYAL